MSTLNRLFFYAATPTTGPLENFTTEALAGAIRSDPVPIMDVLGRHGLLAPDLVAGVEPFTQVYVSSPEGHGYLDLMLQVQMESGPTEVWFENKVEAAEGPGQLAFYRSVIDASLIDGVPRHLVALAPNPINSVVPHTLVPWQHVGAAASRRPGAWLWAELAEFLKEIGMTEDTTLPITAGEAASLGDAHRLFVKTRAIMTRANARARVEITDMPAQHWWPDSRVPGALANQFANQGRFALVSGDTYRAFLVWGAVPRPDGVWFAVWVESDPKRTAIRSDLLRAVEGHLSGWARPHGVWQVLAAERRAVAFESDDEAVEWLVARLHELQDAGVFRLASAASTGPVAEGPEVRTEESGSPDDADR